MTNTYHAIMIMIKAEGYQPIIKVLFHVVGGSSVARRGTALPYKVKGQQ